MLITNLPIEQPSSDRYGSYNFPFALSESAFKHPAAQTPCWDHTSHYFCRGAGDGGLVSAVKQCQEISWVSYPLESREQKWYVKSRLYDFQEKG